MELLKFDPEFPEYLTSEELGEIKWRQSNIDMCRQMLRKDFELLKIQNSFCQIFNDVEFFSKANDDVASIEHAIQIAYERPKEEFIGQHFEHLLECGLQLAFTCYSDKSVNAPIDIERKSRILANLYFESSTFENEFQGFKYFLKRFIQEFPDLDMPWVRTFLSKATTKNWSLL